MSVTVEVNFLSLFIREFYGSYSVSVCEVDELMCCKELVLAGFWWCWLHPVELENPFYQSEISSFEYFGFF